MSDLAEIRAILFDMKEDMGGVRSDVRGLKDAIAERATRLDRVESRVGWLERKLNVLSGIATGITAVFGTALLLIYSLFKYRHDV